MHARTPATERGKGIGSPLETLDDEDNDDECLGREGRERHSATGQRIRLNWAHAQSESSTGWRQPHPSCPEPR